MVNIEKIADKIFSNIENKKQKVVKVATKFHLSGKGRKRCDNCKSYVGARTRICECGYEFKIGTTKHKHQDQEHVSEEDMRYTIGIGANYGGKIVYAGSGPCPTQLTKVDPKHVKQFCEDVVSIGLKNGEIFMISAIKGFLRHEYGDNKDFDTILEHVDEWYSNKMEKSLNHV